MGITSLKDFKWPETTEELSLIGNDIVNPNEVAKNIVDLPNIKGLWLNANPVVSQCSNFSSIAELMPKLEIINSKFTNKAGEWALLYYARD
jgi:tubulin--tyrosine ligase-like protein 12